MGKEQEERRRQTQTGRRRRHVAQRRKRREEEDEKDEDEEEEGRANAGNKETVEVEEEDAYVTLAEDLSTGMESGMLDRMLQQAGAEKGTWALFVEQVMDGNPTRIITVCGKHPTLLIGSVVKGEENANGGPGLKFDQETRQVMLADGVTYDGATSAQNPVALHHLGTLRFNTPSGTPKTFFTLLLPYSSEEGREFYERLRSTAVTVEAQIAAQIAKNEPQDTRKVVSSFYFDRATEVSDGKEDSTEESALDAELPEDAQQRMAHMAARLDALVTEPEDIDVSFDNFPYYYSDDVRKLLVASSYMYLKEAGSLSYVSSLCSMNREILVTGPPHSELYQVALCKALTKSMNARLLNISLQDIENMTSSFPPAQGKTALQQKLGERKRQQQQFAHSRSTIMRRQPRRLPHIMPLDIGALNSSGVQDPGTAPQAGALQQPLVSVRDLAGPRGMGVPGGPSGVMARGRHKTAGGSGSAAAAAIAAATAATAAATAAALGQKSMTFFGVNDRVRYMNPAAKRLPTKEGRAKASTGPAANSVGTVVVVLEEYPLVVGVAFDSAFEGGSDLGGMAPKGHGMFVETRLLRPEATLAVSNDDLLFRVLRRRLAGTKRPTVVLLRSAEKIVGDSFERAGLLLQLMDHLDSAPERARPVLFLGTTTVPQGELKPSPKRATLAALEEEMFRSRGEDMLLRTLMRMQGGKDREGDSDGSSEGDSAGAMAPSRQARVLSLLFRTMVPVVTPRESAEMSAWRGQMERDSETMSLASNVSTLLGVLKSRGLQLPEADEALVRRCRLLKKMRLAPLAAERVVGYAVSDFLQRHSSSAGAGEDGSREPVVDGRSVLRALQLLEGHSVDQRRQALLGVKTENVFEQRLLGEVIPPDEISIRFDDVGALDDVKDTLRELVMLPLQRPELFRRGNLTKPTKGILMFGPPGTGKTMLARAVATECGANFINVSMSAIGSKWFGETEQYVHAVFTLASKIAPSVIFVDEVDSMLGARSKDEHETMRKVKNEFMTCWDGLRTRQTERVLVLVATNRPMDLDDAVLRRLSRRILVDLPDAANREKILQVILKDEALAPGFDVAALAQKTPGYSGSDLKNLCVTAAHQPIRELLRKEKEQQEQGSGSSGSSMPDTVELRPLRMDDFDKALREVSKSVNEDAASQVELRRWNDMYGDSGKHTKPVFTCYI